MRRIVMIASVLVGIVVNAEPEKSSLGAKGVANISGEEEYANPYITEGLIAMWDGEWNIGLGKHDYNSTTWKDLSGRGLNLTDSKFRWIDNALDDSASNIRIDLEELHITGGLTLEAVVMCPNPRNNAFIFDFYNHVDVGCTMYTTALASPYGLMCHLRNGSYSANTDRMKCDDNNRCSCSFIWDDSKWGVFFFGESVGFGNIPFIQPQVYYILGASNVTWQNFRGYVHCLRIYSRALTTDEVSYNYSIDRERFNLP